MMLTELHQKWSGQPHFSVRIALLYVTSSRVRLYWTPAVCLGLCSMFLASFTTLGSWLRFWLYLHKFRHRLFKTFQKWIWPCFVCGGLLAFFSGILVQESMTGKRLHSTCPRNIEGLKSPRAALPVREEILKYAAMKGILDSSHSHVDFYRIFGHC